MLFNSIPEALAVPLYAALISDLPRIVELA